MCYYHLLCGVGCTTLPLPEIHASAFFFLSFLPIGLVAGGLIRLNMLQSRMKTSLCGVHTGANARPICRAMHGCKHVHSIPVFNSHREATKLRRTSLAARKGGEGPKSKPGKPIMKPPPASASRTGLTAAAQLVAEIVASPLFYLVAGESYGENAGERGGGNAGEWAFSPFPSHGIVHRQITHPLVDCGRCYVT